MIPGARAYTTKSNGLVKMINSGSFVQDTSKQKNPNRGNRHKNKKKDEETVRAIIESSPNDTTSELVENKGSVSEESDSEESNGGDSDTSSETEKQVKK